MENKVMGGIRITTSRANRKATARLIGQIQSYLFEQQYGEFVNGNRAVLDAAVKELSRVMKN